jgi:hypothetical protein
MTLNTLVLHEDENFAVGCKKGELLTLAMLVSKAKNKKDLTSEDLKALTGVSQVDGLVPRVIEILHDSIPQQASTSSTSSRS